MTLPLHAVAACIASALASLPAEVPLHRQIDRLIAAGYTDYDRHAAPPAADAEFLRRVTLDLTGTIPSAADARAFLADRNPGKRAQLIDRLLASAGSSRRLAQHFDVTFLERRNSPKVSRAAWEEYLRNSFAANKPYDQLAREILSADGTDPKDRGPAKFLLDRDLDPDVVTRDVGRVFLGRNLRCAQCHDHPLVDDYKQADYYGLLAFFNRSYLFPKKEAADAVVAEKAEGEVTFVSVFDKSKAQKGTPPRVPGLDPIPDPKSVKGKEYKVVPAANVRPVPAYSRRARLAAAVTDKRNKAFARTAANRLWAMMFGRGLVHPLDMDHPDNPPSHPELLNLLADRFAAHRYDVRWLLREIANTRTYQRSSEVPGGRDVPPDRYLAAVPRPLAPEQFGYAVLQATGFLDAERQALGKAATDAALDAKAAPVVDAFRRKFGAVAGEPEDGAPATFDQALFLKYGRTVRNLTAPRPGNTADRLLKLADPAAAADELFLSVLTRFQGDDERREVAEVLKAGGKDPAAVAEVVWAMVTTAEFRFNH